MRSSELFVVKVLWLAGTARDCSTEIEMAGKPRAINTRFFSLSKGNVTGNQEAQPGIMLGMTTETILRKNNEKHQVNEQMKKREVKLNQPAGLSSACRIRPFSIDDHPVLVFQPFKPGQRHNKNLNLTILQIKKEGI